MNYYHLYEIVNFQNSPHTLSKSFFSDGITNPRSIFFSMKFLSILYLHSICGTVYLLKHIVALIFCPLTPSWSWYMTLFYSLPMEYTSLCSPPPPFYLPKKFPLLLNKNSLPSFQPQQKDCVLLETFFRQPWLFPFACLQHLFQWHRPLLVDREQIVLFLFPQYLRVWHTVEAQ